MILIITNFFVLSYVICALLSFSLDTWDLTEIIQNFGKRRISQLLLEFFPLILIIMLDISSNLLSWIFSPSISITHLSLPSTKVQSPLQCFCFILKQRKLNLLSYQILRPSVMLGSCTTRVIKYYQNWFKGPTYNYWSDFILNKKY